MTSTIRRHEALAVTPAGEQEQEEFIASTRAASQFDAIAGNLCALAAFLLPLKLSLTYIVLVPLILGWLYFHRSEIRHFGRTQSTTAVAAPLLFFGTAAVISSALGLSASHSFSSLVSLIFFAATIPLFATCGEVKKVCHALVAGQSIAAIHSFAEAALPYEIPRLFLGKVTESGQIAVTIVVALGLLVTHYQDSSKPSSPNHKKQTASLTTLGFLTTCSLILLSFRNDLGLSPASTCGALTVLTFCLATTLIRYRNKNGHTQKPVLLLAVEISLLACALLVNLKRGPWVGVLLGTSVFLTIYARKAVVALLALSFLATCTITPVQQRLLDSYEHFTISGGRSTIWKIGAELTTEYPLGIGYHNSGILRQFAPEIPSELKHFHNNLLNITAETGWLGGVIFLWLLVAILRLCFKDVRAPLYVAIGCAILSWQTAGLVEYNFGDSEITIMVWALVGLTLQRYWTGKEAQKTSL